MKRFHSFYFILFFFFNLFIYYFFNKNISFCICFLTLRNSFISLQLPNPNLVSEPIFFELLHIKSNWSNLKCPLVIFSRVAIQNYTFKLNFIAVVKKNEVVKIKSILIFLKLTSTYSVCAIIGKISLIN